jgi:ubiquinone/menaquinone biosynthesis C-methylase UbiE
LKSEKRNSDVCSVESAGFLDLKLRKLFQNPEKILKPYIKIDMNVLDVGCGPGFFTIEISKLLNGSGKVIAADLQEGMLLKIKDKKEKLKLNNIQVHKTKKNTLNLDEKVDFILVFYMLHEVPNQKIFLEELKELLNKNGKILISEPKGHVNEKNFEKSEQIMTESGFKIIERPKIFFSRSVLLENIND